MTDKKTTRQNLLLKSGMGTVNAQDYDEGKHGPVVDETDEQYEMRITGKYHPNAGVQTAPGAHPRTTIANLDTFDTVEVHAAALAAAPAPKAVPVIAAPIRGTRVATVSGDANLKIQDAAKK